MEILSTGSEPLLVRLVHFHSALSGFITMCEDVGINISCSFIPWFYYCNVWCLLFIYVIVFFKINVLTYCLQGYHDVKKQNKLIILRTIFFLSCLIKTDFEYSKWMIIIRYNVCNLGRVLEIAGEPKRAIGLTRGRLLESNTWVFINTAKVACGLWKRNTSTTELHKVEEERTKCNVVPWVGF